MKTLRLDRHEPDAARLVLFHTRHKLLLMAHSPPGLRALGQLVAAGDANLQSRHDAYLDGLAALLGKPASTGGHVNALQHAAGYLKSLVSAEERHELANAIDAFARGSLPLSEPLRLIRRHVRAHQVHYLRDQVYLDWDAEGDAGT